MMPALLVHAPAALASPQRARERAGAVLQRVVEALSVLLPVTTPVAHDAAGGGRNRGWHGGHVGGAGDAAVGTRPLKQGWGWGWRRARGPRSCGSRQTNTAPPRPSVLVQQLSSPTGQYPQNQRSAPTWRDGGTAQHRLGRTRPARRKPSGSPAPGRSGPPRAARGCRGRRCCARALPSGTLGCPASRPGCRAAWPSPSRRCCSSPRRPR